MYVYARLNRYNHAQYRGGYLMATLCNQNLNPTITYRQTHTPFAYELGLITEITPLVDESADSATSDYDGRGVAYGGGIYVHPNTAHRGIASRVVQRNWTNLTSDVPSGSTFDGKTPDDVHKAYKAKGKLQSNKPFANQISCQEIPNGFIYDDKDEGFTNEELNVNINQWKRDKSNLVCTNEGWTISGY